MSHWNDAAKCRKRPRGSFARPKCSAFRVGARIVEKASGQPGQITHDYTENLTYPPHSYGCDLGHGYIVVRHRSEIEGMPNVRTHGSQEAGKP